VPHELKIDGNDGTIVSIADRHGGQNTQGMPVGLCREANSFQC